MAQPGLLLTELLEYLTVLLEYLNFFNLSGKAQQTFGALALARPALGYTLLVCMLIEGKGE